MSIKHHSPEIAAYQKYYDYKVNKYGAYYDPDRFMERRRDKRNTYKILARLVTVLETPTFFTFHANKLPGNLSTAPDTIYDHELVRQWIDTLYNNLSSPHYGCLQVGGDKDNYKDSKNRTHAHAIADYNACPNLNLNSLEKKVFDKNKTLEENLRELADYIAKPPAPATPHNIGTCLLAKEASSPRRLPNLRFYKGLPSLQ